MPVALTPQPQKFSTFYARGEAGVPAEGFASQATASDGAVWHRTAHGVMRVDAGAPARDRRQYFSGKRYLPDDHVEGMSPDAAGGMWIRTRTGVSHIELRRMSLAAKAALFEERVRARHNRYGLVAPSNLQAPGDLAANQMRDDDNDGLWTSLYAAAECFRYAVTRSGEALENARASTAALLFLEEVAGRRGYPARSYIRKGDHMPHDGQWHWSADGQYYWKGDTSSDEIVGHFFLYGIATDLLPDTALKARIAATTARIMDHIVDHGYNLAELDGKPTTWGQWSRAYFRQEPSDSPLNSLELLSLLRTAAHITGDSKYAREYRKVALELGYAQLATRYKELREEINYSDEELAMLSFYPLFRYETDGGLLDPYYRPALDAWWENMAREENPLWTCIYALGQPAAAVDLAGAVRTLYRMPVDTIAWTVTNSNREDVEMESVRDRFQHRQSKRLLPPDERPVMKWNTNPFDVDGGDGGRSEDDGAAFLLPYWMGRYQGVFRGE
ncbi:MAG: hypothetical protein ABSH50_03490 [Bryobacteraceae bacterium]